MELKGSILQWPADRPRISRLIFFVLGALFTTTFAPFGLSLLMPLILIPVLYVCLTVSPRDAAGHMFWFGFGLFLTGTYWIYISVVVFGNSPAWIAILLMLGLVLIMSIWMAITGWMTSLLSHGEPMRLLWVAPATWVLVEWLRGWVFTGFPWLAVGYSQVDLPMAGFAPVLGVYGVSFAMLFSAAAILQALMSKDMLRNVSVGVALLPWIIGGGLCFVDWTEPSGKALKTTILQAGISQDRKWLPEQLEPTLAYYRNATRRAADSELIVWPEAALPFWPRWEQHRPIRDAFLEQIRQDSARNGQVIVFGMLEHDQSRGDDRIFNSLFMIEGGAERQVYRKRHLVPFGEYFPVPDKTREWLRMMSLPASDMSKGMMDQPLLTTRSGIGISSVICYEDAYGSEQLYAFPEAQIIINVSNDAWFGDSIAPHQHLEIARMRSLEFGRPTIRATSTGISAFIDAQGELVAEGPQFQQARLTRSVQPHSGTTPYINYGNLPVVILCVLLLGFFWFRSRASL